MWNLKMLKKLLCLLPLLWFNPAQASFSVNQTADNYVSGGTTVSVSISVPSGHTVAVGFSMNPGVTISSITDSGSHTYTQGTAGADSFGRTVSTAYSIAISSSITSVTMNFASTTTALVFVWDVTNSSSGTISVASGGTNGNAYNASTTTATNGITTNSLTITTTNGLLLAVGEDFSSGTLSAGTGFTSDGTFFSLLAEHEAVSASAAATMTDNTAGNYAAASGLAFQLNPPVVTNGVVISNGHPVKSGSSVLYK